MKKSCLIAGTALIILAVACSHEAKWKLEGNVEDGAGKTVYLQSSQNGNWLLLDSVQVGNNGKFTLRSATPSVPAIYRLEMDGKFAYIPVDSAETITFTSTASGFGTAYTLDGSTDARIMTRANELIASLNSPDMNVDSVKRLLGEQILIRPSGASAYYIINSTFADGSPVFNISGKMDSKIIGAVANAFINERPNDPRTKIIERTYMLSRASAIPEEVLRAKVDSITSKISTGSEIGFLEIELKDFNGNTRLLSESVGNGPVILNFTVYGEDYGPGLNLVLGELYKQYHDKGLEIYQVGFDSDSYDWRNVARNLPWVAVHNPASAGTQYLLKYNTKVPMSFIINSNGDIVERVQEPADLKEAVKKYL